MLFPLLFLACSRPAPPAPPDPPAPVLEHHVIQTAEAPPNATLPLLIAVHGLGDRPEHFQGAVADLQVPARVVLPRAPTPTASGGGSWFAFRRDDLDRASFGLRLHTAAEEVVALTDWAEDHFPTAGDPVITGFSQGGMVSFAVAAGWPDHIAAAFPVGGDLPLSLVPASPPAHLPHIEAFHGDDDRVVPIAGPLAAIAALAERGYTARLHRYAGLTHGISEDLRAAWHAALETALGEQALR
ncbi:MAG: dienelactone hydrolase family protein [Pseudomonadota bacterium]